MMGKGNLIAEPGKQEMTYTRTFDAPPELVYRAFTEPELYRQWLGPKSLTMTIEQMDVRPGGSWRYIHSDGQGGDYGFHGVYHAVEPNRRLVDTFEFEGMPGHVSLEEATFKPQGNGTKLTIHSVYQSVADRDGMVSSGMEGGMSEGFEKLDELLKQLQAGKVPAR
jgi:uncharacterized protein YndB with AHSA1/START domain